MSNNRQNRKNISGLNGGFSFLPQITDRTSEQFLQDIIKVQENQYTPITYVPTLFGRRIDLLKIYNAVAQRGGLKKMVTELSWQGVMKDLNIPVKCANACVALRSIYQRYLEQFERLQRNKATISDIEEELQIESENRYRNITQKSTLTHFNINPNNMVYRSDIHQINSHKRQETGLSCDLSDVFEYRNLEMSLKSGLVNEIEFSLNTCLLMSYQTEGIHLWRNPKLLNLILSSVSITDSNVIYNQSCIDSSGKRFLRFWNNTVIDENGRKFLNADVFIKENIETPSLDILNQIFTINEELTIYDKEGQRIQLVATIIRNLAFDNSNGRFLTQDDQSIRFILLCCYASHFALHQLGLEIISMLRFPICGVLIDTFSHLLVDLIRSEDRVDRLRGLELISRLCDQTVCTENIDFFISLPKRFFASLISTLIVHDLHLLVLGLEAVYALSEVDPILCLRLIDCSSETLITLYTLLSLEAQVMGTQSLIRIRVMQGPSVITATSINSTNTSRTNSCTPHQNQKQLATSLMPPPPVPHHKVPISAMPVSHITNIKSQNFVTSDISNSLKSTSSQKMCSIITKVTISETPSILSTQNQVNDSILTTKPFLVSQNNVNGQYTHSQKLVLSSSQNVVPTTSLAPVKSTVASYSPIIKTTCISTPLPSVLLESSHNSGNINNSEVSTSSLSLIQTPSKSSTTVNTSSSSSNNVTAEIDSSIKETGNASLIFTKQEFVKSWLLNNYIEFPQCTVPLFLIYKQLQIAVQNHFKDSEMVSAEEFHRLVRLLFPQVQLVQLYTTGGAVEIHYYNLKSSPKTTTLELLLESPKLKPILSNSYEINNCNIKNNVPIINKAQSNNVHELMIESKSLKRHSNESTNGFSSEICDSNHLPKKKAKFNDNQNMHYPSNQVNNQKIAPSVKESKENHLKCFQLNGVQESYFTKNEYQNHHVQSDQLINDRTDNSYSINSYHNQNGSIKEELKHSDSEIKGFSSAVSPTHCENLPNGTDVGIEVKMEPDLSKRNSIIVSKGTPISCSNEYGVPVILSHNSENVVTSTSSDDASTSDSSQQRRSHKKINSNQLGRTRSRFRNNSSNTKGKQRSYSNQRPHNLSYLYICEWDSCLQSFDKPQKVYGHVYTNHFMTLRTEVESICLWAGCEDKTHRTPLPLLNHVNEQHCNNVALESARQMRLASEKERTTLVTSESNPKCNTDHITSPKFVNINTNNSPSKIITSNNEIPVSSITNQLVSQSSISHISNVKNSKVVSSSSQLQIPSPPTRETVSVSVLEPFVISTQMITSISSAIQTSFVAISSSQKEISISSSNNTKIPQILESRSSSQILPKVKSSINFCTPLSSSSTVIPSTQNDVSAAEPSQFTSQSTKEGPVTKHIRFLSALILRNLCQNSNIARRFVSARHQQIFEMSISGCESSMALSECLLFSSNEINGN